MLHAAVIALSSRWCTNSSGMRMVEKSNRPSTGVRPIQNSDDVSTTPASSSPMARAW